MKRPSKPSRFSTNQPDPGVWLWGLHPVQAALKNPRRRCYQLWSLPELAEKVKGWAALHPQQTPVQQVDKHMLDAKFPQAVHQGVALCVEPLQPLSLMELCERAGDRSVVLVLDHVTDPQNVGALLRVAAALGVEAVLLTDKHAPPFQGALAKSASGALEQVPLVLVSNLAQSLDFLKKHGFWCVGLAEEGATALSDVALGDKLALVVGAEGEGLRRLTRERCDLLAFLPTSPEFRTLNVSTAGAIALYELQMRRHTKKD